MALDPSVQWSPAWWAAELTRRLDERTNGSRWNRDARRRGRARERGKPGLRLLDDYLHGEPPLPRATDAWRDGMRAFLRLSRMNYADLCVSSVSERMDLLGFKTAADDDESGDTAADDIAKANEMRSWLPELWDDMIALGWAYASVGPRDKATGVPLVALESPFQCYQATDATGRRPLAQVKRALDEWTGKTVTWVWSSGDPSLPGPLKMHQITQGADGAGYGRGGEDGETVAGFPLHEFRNRDGAGDFETHLDVLDRINDTIFERVVIAKYQAYKQRVAIGTPDTDGDGNPIDYSAIFTTDPGAVMRLPKDSQMWESGAVDLGPIRAAIKDDVMAFAAVTRSPVHYIVPDAANGSATGADAARESYRFRVGDRRRRAERPLARLMASAFKAEGDEKRANALAIEPIWEALETPSMNDRASAFAQARANGWPFGDAATRFMGVPPSELTALQDSRGDDLLFAQASAPDQPAPPEQTVTQPAQAPAQSPADAAVA